MTLQKNVPFYETALIRLKKIVSCVYGIGNYRDISDGFRVKADSDRKFLEELGYEIEKQFGLREGVLPGEYFNPYAKDDITLEGIVAILAERGIVRSRVVIPEGF